MAAVAQGGRGASGKDLKLMVGNWAGTIMLTDNSKEKSQVSLPATLEVADMGDLLMLSFSYTDTSGKQVTEKSSMRIYEDGNKLSFRNNELEISATHRRPPFLTIIADREGKDNGKTADIMETITIGTTVLKFVKEVRYEEMETYFIRSRCSLNKK